VSAQPQHNQEPDRFRKLQELLFVEDGKLTDAIQEEIESLRGEVRDKKEIEARVQPFIEQKVEYLQENFSELFGPVMATTIKRQIQESQDEMIDALYPIIGKLIRKFISKELERLSKQIDRSVNEAFSWKGIKRWISKIFRGETAREAMEQEIIRPDFEEVFIIDKESGLLAGSWSRQETADQDMIAGMLTAIKSFVESAFQAGAQDLETIEYDTYKILIHNFHTFYIAVIVSGPVTQEFRGLLFDYIMAFSEKNAIVTRTDIDDALLESNSLKLKAHFDDFTSENQ